MQTKRTVFSNDEGFFSIQCQKTAHLKFSFVGCIPYWIELSQPHDTFIVVNLMPDTVEAVYVKAREKLYMQTLLGKTTVTAASINKSPTFAGIPDAIKSMATLPGITSGKEGFSYLHVRGGTLGQNLILLDGAPLLQYNHAAGLVSAINTYAVENIDIYKSGFPARFGNCSSSILDFRMREGNKNSYVYKLEIGTLSTQATAEGPLSKAHTGSFLVAARTTYFDIINIPTYLRYLDTLEYQNDLKSTDGVSYASMNAFDLNTKISQEINSRNKVYFHAFISQDFLKTINESEFSKDNVGYRNSNVVFSGGIKSSFTEHIFLNLQLSYSANYTKNFNNYDLKEDLEEKTEKWIKTSMQYGMAKASLDIFVNNMLTFKTGFEYDNFSTKPYIDHKLNVVQDVITIDTTIGNNFKYNAQSYALFAESEYKPVPGISTLAGIRGIYFSSSDKLWGIEPRLSLRWLISESSSIKINYTYTRQFLHQLLLYSYGRYITFWIPANKEYPAESVHQVSAGFFGVKNSYEFGIEGFYKNMNHLVESMSTDNSEVHTSIYDKLALPGWGDAYGMETYIEKDFGHISAGINYTLMWSWRQSEDINGGKRYPFTYNHRHVLNSHISLPINREWSITADWQFMSGQPFTVPVGYSKGTSTIYDDPLFEGVNNITLPPYHRLDLLVMREWISKKSYHKYAKISVYNAYNRRNPSYARVSDGKLVIMSLYGIIPTVSYGWNF
jgi:outer membrane receptor for ferrienterochelin and colicin